MRLDKAIAMFRGRVVAHGDEVEGEAVHSLQEDLAPHVVEDRRRDATLLQLAKREVRRRMMNVARTMTSDLGERMLEARRLVTTV